MAVIRLAFRTKQRNMYPFTPAALEHAWTSYEGSSVESNRRVCLSTDQTRDKFELAGNLLGLLGVLLRIRAEIASTYCCVIGSRALA